MMDEDVTKLLLNGMPFSEFIVFYVWAFIGAMLLFWISVGKAIKKDPETPDRWSWMHLWKGVCKIPLTMVIMAVAIIFWEQISKIMFDSETDIELTMWSAFFIVGFGSEKIKDMVFGGSKETVKAFKKLK
jgi:hypothetical protein